MADEHELEQVADDHPQYDLPAEVGRGAGDASGVSDGAAGEVAPPTQDAASDGTPDQPVAQIPEQTPEAPPAASPTPDQILAYLIKQNETLAAQVQHFLQQQGRPQAPAPPPPPVVERSEEDIALEQRLLERVPFLATLKRIADEQKLAQLERFIETAPRVQETISQFSDEIAEHADNRVISLYAERRGIDPSQVPAATRNHLLRTFISNVSETPQLHARFNRGDLRVVDEVMSGVFDVYGLPTPAPAAGPPAAEGAAPQAPRVQTVPGLAVVQRHRQGNTLPRSGGNVPPPVNPQPTVNYDDEDAVHGAAWAAARAAVGQ